MPTQVGPVWEGGGPCGGAVDCLVPHINELFLKHYRLHVKVWLTRSDKSTIQFLRPIILAMSLQQTTPGA